MAQTAVYSQLSTQASYNDYVIAWVTPLEVETIAAILMLDEIHAPLRRVDNDDNSYNCGKIGQHDVVIMSPSRTGSDAVSHAVTNMARTFKNLRFVILVGIGGGAPKVPVGKGSNGDGFAENDTVEHIAEDDDLDQDDLMLGDVVVAFQENERSSRHGFVLQYDMGKYMSDGTFDERSYIRKPQSEIINSLKAWKLHRMIRGTASFRKYIEESVLKAKTMAEENDAKSLKRYKFPGRRKDRLYKVVGSSSEPRQLVERTQRTPDNPVIHWGLIASANAVMGDGKIRDELRDKYGVLCFEMEAAGLMNDFPCVVIRGISDYSDDQKNDVWHSWASLTAAAAAKEFLSVVQPQDVQTTKAVYEIITDKLKKIQEGQQEESQRQKVERAKASLNGLRKKLKISYDLSRKLKNKHNQDHCDKTSEWIWNEDHFKDWTSELPKDNVLCVYGNHGVGKSVLCAATIDHLAKAYPRSLIIYAFIHKSEPVSKIGLLRHLATQLLDAIPSDDKEVPEYLKKFLDIDNESFMRVEDLIIALLSNRHGGDPTYIFIDGLDEREYYKQPRSIAEDSVSKENKKLIFTLVSIANQKSNSARLWFSTQRFGIINECFQTLKTPSIEINTEKTFDDIQRYLISAMPESITDSSQVEETICRSDRTFLWASSVYRDLEEVRGRDDVSKVLDSVPRSFNDQYLSIITRIQQRVLEGPNIRGSEPPIWKIVLSMLVFTNRPLSLYELMEGVAILRTEASADMKLYDNYPDIDPRDILDACMSLIVLLPSEEEYHQSEREKMIYSTVILCHGTLRKFLKNDMNSIDRPSEEFVDSRTMGKCCILFFMQPKFKTLLEKVGDETLLTQGRGGSRYQIDSSSLIFYAAKYWHRHFDIEIEGKESQEYTSHKCQKTPDKKTIKMVVNFLQSPNFVTCIQVQSLCVEGHFIQSYDRITDRVKRSRRALPNWLKEVREDLFCQYEEFISEWGEFLQSGSSQYANGQLDKCLWPTLGDHNFLSKQKSRYNCVLLKGSSCCESQIRCGNIVQEVSRDETRFISVAFCRAQDSAQLLVNIWDLKALARSQVTTPLTTTFEPRNSGRLSSKLLAGRLDININGKDADIVERGAECVPKQYPLLPSPRCIAPPDVIAFFETHDGPLVRIGSNFFMFSAVKGVIKADKQDDSLFVDSWENICSRDNYLVASRRRSIIQNGVSPSSTYSSSIFDSSSENEENIRASSGDDSWDDDYDVDADSSSGGSDHTFDSGNTAENGTDEEDTFSQIEYDEEGKDSDIDSQEHDTRSDSSCFNSESENEGSDNMDIGLDLDEILSVDSNDMECASLCSDTSPPRFPADLPEMIRRPSDILSSRSNFPKEALAALPNNRQRITIEDMSQNYLCMVDGCKAIDSKFWYVCPSCSPKTDCLYSICGECESGGRWCLQKNHLLYEMLNGKAVDVIAKNDYTAKNHIEVFDKSASPPKILFSFQEKPTSMLHESPPAIHPRYPLVVWALNGKQILFGDIENNSWRKWPMGASDTKGVPICSNLSFSSCGNFLRVAKIEATAKTMVESVSVPASYFSEYTQNSLGLVPQLCLALRVVVMSISAKRPTRSQPQKMFEINLNLGRCEKPLIRQLPFTFTWTDQELFITLSSSRLRVYRVNIRSESITSISKLRMKSTEPEIKIEDDIDLVTTPKEVIFLPRSARDRKVKYLPSEQSGQPSTVIIGPRSNRSNATSMALYLTDADLGGWIDIQQQTLAEAELFFCHFKEMHEKFDEDEDCDTIPLSNDKW